MAANLRERRPIITRRQDDEEPLSFEVGTYVQVTTNSKTFTYYNGIVVDVSVSGAYTIICHDGKLKKGLHVKVTTQQRYGRGRCRASK